MQLPIFVYGTLRQGESNVQVIAPFVTQVEPAEMAGLQLWDLGPYPVAVDGTGRVRGELVTLDSAQYAEALARLDELEGVDPVAPTRPGGLFYRARRTVLLPGCGGPLPEAWVYLGDPATARRGRRVDGGDWQRRTGR